MPNHAFHFDAAGVRFDAGFFLDGGGPAQTQKFKNMATFKLNLSKKNPGDLIALADTVIPMLAPAAPGTPPIANIAAKVADLTAARDTAKISNDAYDAAIAALPNLKAVRDADADALRVEHQATASAIESETKGDAVKMTASGYALAHAAVQTTSPPAQVRNFGVTAGDADGSVDYQHDPMDNVTYEVQLTTGDPVTGPWTTKVSGAGASKGNIDGLTSGQRVWGRARAINSKGPGPWSDPASKIVP